MADDEQQPYGILYLSANRTEDFSRYGTVILPTDGGNKSSWMIDAALQVHVRRGAYLNSVPCRREGG